MTNFKELFAKSLLTLLLGVFGWGALLAVSLLDWAHLLVSLLGICAVMLTRERFDMLMREQEKCDENDFHPAWLTCAIDLGIKDEILGELGIFLLESPFRPTQEVDLVKRWAAMNEESRKMLKEELTELHLNHLRVTSAFENQIKSKKKLLGGMR